VAIAGQGVLALMLEEIADIELELLIEAILRKYQYDFRHYSRSSLKRRAAQAMAQLGCKNISQLQERVLHERGALPIVLDYLTVPTTELFRDPEYYGALRTEVIPHLHTYPSLKVWVAGCSTGEEVYSTAILLEESGLLGRAIIYATDINPRSLEKAKRGIYSLDSLKQASVNYQRSGGKRSLSDYYRAAYEAVQLDRRLVRNAVFSDHSLATDAVFTEVQLVSCRNVLIYFDRPLQDRAIGLFYDSLVRRGFLGLGSKESLHFSSHQADFKSIADEARIYQKQRADEP
jgi:chemotaxis protein methyltransferase CheR